MRKIIHRGVVAALLLATTAALSGPSAGAATDPLAPQRASVRAHLASHVGATQALAPKLTAAANRSSAYEAPAGVTEQLRKLASQQDLWAQQVTAARTAATLTSLEKTIRSSPAVANMGAEIDALSLTSIDSIVAGRAASNKFDVASIDAMAARVFAITRSPDVGKLAADYQALISKQDVNVGAAITSRKAAIKAALTSALTSTTNAALTQRAHDASLMIWKVTYPAVLESARARSYTLRALVQLIQPPA